MVVEARVMLPRLGRERHRVRRRPDCGDVLVERLAAGVQSGDRAELATPDEFGVELVGVALAVEDARAVAFRLAVPDHPPCALAMHAHTKSIGGGRRRFAPWAQIARGRRRGTSPRRADARPDCCWCVARPVLSRPVRPRCDQPAASALDGVQLTARDRSPNDSHGHADRAGEGGNGIRGRVRRSRLGSDQLPDPGERGRASGQHLHERGGQCVVHARRVDGHSSRPRLWLRLRSSRSVTRSICSARRWSSSASVTNGRSPCRRSWSVRRV